MEDTMRNVQRRVIDAPIEQAQALLQSLPEVWPSPTWPMITDHGHGPIRYHEVSADTNARHFVFDPPTGIWGHHEFSAHAVGPHRTELRHVLSGRVAGRMRILWPTAVRWLHGALVQDLFDNIEYATTGKLIPRRHSVWVTAIRRVLQMRPQRIDVRADADLADAWSLPLPRGLSTDPLEWTRHIFRDPPGTVRVLFGVRNLLVRLVGIEPGDRNTFTPRNDNGVTRSRPPGGTSNSGPPLKPRTAGSRSRRSRRLGPGGVAPTSGWSACSTRRSCAR
jgi:hypothetical protein